jgi:hypothetical protein
MISARKLNKMRERKGVKMKIRWCIEDGNRSGMIELKVNWEIDWITGPMAQNASPDSDKQSHQEVTPHLTNPKFDRIPNALI